MATNDEHGAPVVLTSVQLASEEWRPAEEFEPLTFEKVIGINNLLNIAWLSEGLTLAAPVVRVVTPEWPSTGFLIGPDLLLTNNHVLPVEPIAAKTFVEFNYQLTWAGTPEPVKRYPLDTSLFRTNEELDYSISRVQGSPGDLFGYVDLSQRTDPTVNDFVSIIQHPKGGPKQICFTDNKVAAVFGNLVQYSTDTEPGSSGSPVFNQSWQIVGLHHKGGGLAGPDGKKYWTNEAILITAVIRDAAQFLGLSDALYDLAFGELRSVLVNLIDEAEPPPDPVAVLPDLVRTHPRLSFAVDEWVQLNAKPGQAPIEAVAGAGVAVGAALRQWARSSGHESIKAASASTPPPSDALVQLVSRFSGSTDVPSDVYAQVLATIRADETLVAPIVAQIGADTSATATVRSFLVSVTVGGKAYDAPPVRS